MKNFNFVFKALIFLVIIATASCKKETGLTNEKKIEIALDEFVIDLSAFPPDSNNISGRIRNYLMMRDDIFFGATVALLDSGGYATYSPYWCRSGDTLRETNLADTSYHINEQQWLREPIDSAHAIWTAPYFDAGGGNIWMKTRSVPVFSNGRIIAVATTDLAL